MIERKNIIKLLGERSNVYHSALLTTYSFDPIFFESVYLSTLRKLGITNIVVLMDASMYDKLLADTSYQCHRVTQNNYTLVRQENNYSGVFHPKMVLLFGEEEGSLVLGSGNLTYSGLSYNEEIWSAFHVNGGNSVHYPLFYKAWKYLREASSSVSPLVLRQIDWMQEQCPWLREESNNEIISLLSGEECQFLYNSAEATILTSLYANIGEKEVDEITVISPFYDTGGLALKELKHHFSPKSMRCVIDLDRQSAPYSLLQDDFIAYHKSTSHNPLHAKIIEIQGKNETWLLCGSANAGRFALGVSTSSFNDEACILLHSKVKKDYISELGISFTALTSEEKKAIVRPKQEIREELPRFVKLISCEEKEKELFLRFDEVGVEGKMVLLDNAQREIFCSDIITDREMSVSVGDIDIEALHIAVLKKDDNEISNRVLIIREIHVERGNPDPKRRKLSSLLDDAGLLVNLGHILGYIEFDETDKKTIASKSVKTTDKGNKEDDSIVTRERFNELKDSKLSISMHSGVRILAYLQQILFQNGDDSQTDDELLELDEENVDKDGSKEETGQERDRKQSDVEEALRMRSDVVNFLKNMQNFLLDKTKDQRIYGEKAHAVDWPKLMAVPGLNAASSMAVASRAVICLMNKYGQYIIKTKEVKDLLIKDAGVFLSLYANQLPPDDSIRNCKIREILKDATVDLLTALCFFAFPKGDSSFTQLVLNSLEFWKNCSELNEMLQLVEQQLQKLNPDYLVNRTIKNIRHIADVYLDKETPIEEFSVHHHLVYQLRSGYGFLVVDNIQRIDNSGWQYYYHSPWFEGRVEYITSTKYKGYYEL